MPGHEDEELKQAISTLANKGIELRVLLLSYGKAALTISRRKVIMIADQIQVADSVVAGLEADIATIQAKFAALQAASTADNPDLATAIAKLQAQAAIVHSMAAPDAPAATVTIAEAAPADQNAAPAAAGDPAAA